jgi:hypothetical protein
MYRQKSNVNQITQENMVATTAEKRQDGGEACPLEAAIQGSSNSLENDKCGGPDTGTIRKSSCSDRRPAYSSRKATKSSAGELSSFITASI